MSTLYQTLKFAVTATLLGVGATASHADVVYDNRVNALQVLFNPGSLEVGDEIVLDGSLRRLTSFSFEYYGTNFSGNEQAQVRFYANDGPLFNGYATPNTVLFDSGLFSIYDSTRFGGGILNNATANFNSATLGPTLDVPDQFTWSVQFAGVEAGEAAGLTLFSPVVVGGNFQDYWQLNGSSWALMADTGGNPVNFGAHFEATVPEPSTVAYLALGGMLGALVMFGRRRG